MQKLTLLDYVYITALILVTFFVFGSNILRCEAFLACGAIAWSFAHITHLRHLMKTALPTEAVVVDYSVKTKKIDSNGLIRSDSEKCLVYAPVLRYETDTQVLEIPYSVYEENRWFQDGEQYMIHYIASKPELFYFPGREDELTSHYGIVILLAGILLILTVFLGLPILLG